MVLSALNTIHCTLQSAWLVYHAAKAYCCCEYAGLGNQLISQGWLRWLRLMVGDCRPGPPPPPKVLRCVAGWQVVGAGIQSALQTEGQDIAIIESCMLYNVYVISQNVAIRVKTITNGVTVFGTLILTTRSLFILQI